MTSPRDFPWNDENVERLKELCAEGLSGGQIANEMNLTRSQVVGKLHRLGLSLHSQRAAGGYSRVTYKSKQPKAERNGGAVMNALKAIETPYRKNPAKTLKNVPKLSHKQKDFILGVPLEALTDHRCGCLECISLGPRIDPQKCRWPLDDPKPGKEFCGAKQMQGLPYCKHHATVAYQGGYQAAMRRQAVVIRDAVERLRRG